MDQEQYEAAKSRTDAKLQYAAVHLDELRGVERRGNEFEKAHQESFLFHLFGARDAFLQELNLFHEGGLPLKKATRENLSKALKDAGKNSNALKKLTELESNPDSWLSCAKEMRDYSMHRHSVPRVYHIGGERNGEVFLTDTRNGKAVEDDYLALFKQWLDNMRNLIKELRNSN